MFNKRSNSKKARVFLGSVDVMPRTDLKRHIEPSGVFQSESIDDSLRAALLEIFALPPAADVVAPEPADLGLDIVIPTHTSGDYIDVSLGGIGLPLFWRPRITVTGKLYHLQSRKTMRSFSVTRKMPWGVFLARQMSWRAVLAPHPAYDAQDMKVLLCMACHTLLDKLRKAV